MQVQVLSWAPSNSLGQPRASSEARGAASLPPNSPAREDLAEEANVVALEVHLEEGGIDQLDDRLQLF
ncbi:MAG: hypothetical protein VX992_04765, partial [Acidobacteriota bacterium]|nr:hypothetical protein [Acidobacteriota bacterium]